MDDPKTQALKNHQSKLTDDLHDVQCQIEQLAAEQEVIKLQLTAVEKHLGGNDEKSGTVMVRKLNGQSLKGMGFREAVRTTLERSDRSLRPKEIANHLKQSDFEYTGRLDMYLRVGNELRNLKKAGKIRSTKGLYRLVR